VLYTYVKKAEGVGVDIEGITEVLVLVKSGVSQCFVLFTLNSWHTEREGWLLAIVHDLLSPTKEATGSKNVEPYESARKSEVF